MNDLSLNDQLKHVGGLLQERRTERNFSLKEIENGTSIRINYLQAIEQGRLNNLISPVYAQGFIKQYAQFLGLDGDRLINENLQSLKDPQCKQEFAYGLGTLEVRGAPGSGVKWLPNVLWIGASFLGLLALWIFAKYMDVL